MLRNNSAFPSLGSRSRSSCSLHSDEKNVNGFTEYCENIITVSLPFHFSILNTLVKVQDLDGHS
jgi:hypothetical protein